MCKTCVIPNNHFHMIHVLYVVNLYVECYVTTESNPTREDLCSAQIPYVSLYKNARRCCKGIIPLEFYKLLILWIQPCSLLVKKEKYFNSYPYKNIFFTSWPAFGRVSQTMTPQFWRFIVNDTKQKIESDAVVDELDKVDNSYFKM